MLGEEENGDSKAKIEEFMIKLSKHQEKFPMKSFSAKDNQGKRARTDGNEDAGTGAGGSGAADHAVLRAHGYEVKPDVIQDDDGIAWEPLFKGGPALSTYYMAS